jgi:hypothetical protein
MLHTGQETALVEGVGYYITSKDGTRVFGRYSDPKDTLREYDQRITCEDIALLRQIIHSNKRLRNPLIEPMTRKQLEEAVRNGNPKSIVRTVIAPDGSI